MMSTSQLQREIHEQPTALAGLLNSGWGDVGEAAHRVRAFAPEWVNIAARGTSDNAARYAQYLFGAYNKLGVGLAVPSLFTLYGAPPTLGRALTIGISQSGQSPDVVTVVEEARRQHGMTLAITNDPASPLARAAHATIRLATEEHSVAATKTYTNELMAIAMLSAALEQDNLRRIQLKAIPDAVEEALRSAYGLHDLVAPFKDDRRFLVVSRGFNYCTAFEVALKMKETSYVLAEPYSVADLLHGPVAMIDDDFPVILIAPTGRAADSAVELLDRLDNKLQRVIALSDQPQILDAASLPIPLPCGVPEWLSPIISIVPGQLLASALAFAKGIDPDSPRGLSKVTLTH